MSYAVEIKKGQWQQVATLEEASRAVRRFISAHDLTMHTFRGGRLIGEGEKIVGRVSYNGRVWGLGTWPNAPLLWSPF